MKSTKRKKPNKIIDAMHETMKDLHGIGLVDKTTMSNFDALCLPKIKPYSPICHAQAMQVPWHVFAILSQIML